MTYFIGILKFFGCNQMPIIRTLFQRTNGRFLLGLEDGSRLSRITITFEWLFYYQEDAVVDDYRSMSYFAQYETT